MAKKVCAGCGTAKNGDEPKMYKIKMSEVATSPVTAAATALEGDRFVLHYQPKVATQSGKLVGCEALLRCLRELVEMSESQCSPKATLRLKLSTQEPTWSGPKI